MGEARREALEFFPHGITLSRLILTGFAYDAVLLERRWLFTGLVLAAVATDILDGPVARRLGTVTPYGANLDTAVDIVFYGSLLVWAHMWDPTILQGLWPVVVVMAVLLFGSLAHSHARRGLLGFHSRYTKASCTAGVVATLWVVIVGFTPLLVYGLLVILLADVAHRFSVTLSHPRGGEAEGDQVERPD